MKSSKKYLGINQWIPLSVMDGALHDFLKTGEIDKESIRQHLREFLKGENRLGKAAEYMVQIIARNEEQIKLLASDFTAAEYLKRPERERSAILLSLLCLTYPVAYDLMVALAAGFKVQPTLNRDFCSSKMSSVYGSNRGVYNAIGAVLPTLIETGSIKREKVGLYSFGEKLTALHPLVSELIVYTDIKLSGSKSVLLDDIDYRPWYFYFEINFGKKKSYRLVKFTESRVGQGYLAA